MKRYLFIPALIVLYMATFAQSQYKYVIIPTYFGDFSPDFNPYGLSSLAQKELGERSIDNFFSGADLPGAYCEALTLNLVKSSSLLKNKLRAELKDCKNNVVWSQEGTGHSKDYREGYGQALVEALSGLKQLPANPNVVSLQESPAAISPAPQQSAKPTGQNVQQPANDLGGDIYSPSNPYYNYTYLVDLVENGEGQKELIIINSEPLGYEKLQKIATLKPTGLEDVYDIEWASPTDKRRKGIARLVNGELKISFLSEGGKEIITLREL